MSTILLIAVQLLPTCFNQVFFFIVTSLIIYAAYRRQASVFSIVTFIEVRHYLLEIIGVYGLFFGFITLFRNEKISYHYHVAITIMAHGIYVV